MYSTSNRPRVYRSRGRRRLLAARSIALGVVAATLAGTGLLIGSRLAGWGPAQQVAPAKATPTALTPEIVARFDAAAEAARADGIELGIRSGWRSAEEQRRLYDDAVAEHGVEEARRIVLPPEHSAHVAGSAVDITPYAGATWLEARAEEYGLCRTYANEWWHFEVTGAVGDRCPDLKPDASVDW
ncbi:D-alanyl-D-alanine carboxypeptidase family protein [Tessaracoccus aquimaris]|uniref:D-alanyl-D-alanine carboxypeptidase family protein n=1 Tax=Tessaracoccus aquimaris TaxID=1332264 RepID=UPI0009898604|nr:D-alanyl-D-alanine carboxypeptidase family protein [Tessaracoccus aquimaris]